MVNWIFGSFRRGFFFQFATGIDDKWKRWKTVPTAKNFAIRQWALVKGWMLKAKLKIIISLFKLIFAYSQSDRISSKTVNQQRPFSTVTIKFLFKLCTLDLGQFFFFTLCCLFLQIFSHSQISTLPTLPFVRISSLYCGPNKMVFYILNSTKENSKQTIEIRNRNRSLHGVIYRYRLSSLSKGLKIMKNPF